MEKRGVRGKRRFSVMAVMGKAILLTGGQVAFISGLGLVILVQVEVGM